MHIATYASRHFLYIATYVLVGVVRSQLNASQCNGPQVGGLFGRSQNLKKKLEITFRGRRSNVSYFSEK